MSPVTASDPFATAVDVPSAREIVSPLQDHVMLDRGGNVRERAGPRRRHGAFHQHARLRRVDLIPGQRTRSHPRKIRAVGNLAVNAPALVRPERSLRQPLHGFVKLRIRAPQRLNLRNIQHDSSCDRVMRSECCGRPE